MKYELASNRKTLQRALSGSIIMLIMLVYLPSAYAHLDETRTITDAMGRTHEIPVEVDKVICSNSGCLRLLTYLQAHDRIVAVDSIEIKGSPTDAKITTTIKAKLAADPEISAFDVSVSTTEGKVTLSGKVKSPEMIGKAVALALETGDVREVVSVLKIE